MTISTCDWQRITGNGATLPLVEASIELSTPATRGMRHRRDRGRQARRLPLVGYR